MILKKTYSNITPPEPALNWEEYEKLIMEEWEEMHTNKECNTEKDFQHFFEKHPCMLPWLYGEIHRGAHGVFPASLISQPNLPGLNTKIPDFMWIASDSGSIFVVLIEIEHPSKPWATQKGVQS